MKLQGNLKDWDVEVLWNRLLRGISFNSAETEHFSDAISKKSL